LPVIATVPNVVAVAHRQHLVGLARDERGRQRRLVRLRAGVGEEDLGVLDAAEPGDLLGQLHLAADQVQRGGVHDPAADLPLDGLADLRDVIAEHVGEDAGEEVEVAAARGVGDARPLAADDLDRLVVIDADPVRDDRAVAGE
jgi:hypothetical protein